MKPIFFGCFIAFSQFIIAQTATFKGFTYHPEASEIRLLENPTSSYTEQLPPFSFGKNREGLKLNAGTPIFLRTTEIIDFETITEGQPINFLVSKDVVVAGEVIVRSNVLATGIIQTKKEPTVNRAASVIIKVNMVNAVDGQAIKLYSEDQCLKGKFKGQTFSLLPNKSVVAYVMNNQMIQIP